MKRGEAYEKYYEVKFQNMREKKAIAVYHDYLSRVKSNYNHKK